MSRRVELWIDGVVVDLADRAGCSIGYDAERMTSPERAAECETVEIEVPRGPVSDALMGCGGLPLFNSVEHEGRLMCDGAVLVVGRCVLKSCTERGYVAEIRYGGAGWARMAAQRRMRELPLQFETALTPSAIARSWTDGGLVKFLPVWRDSYEQRNSPEDLKPVARLLVPDDYHPFVSVEAVWRAIFEQAGYVVESRFAAGDRFKSLYFSGAYAEHDTAAAEARMGFRAVRLAEKSAVADAVGRVYATPFGAENILGNFVDTATPLAEDETGMVHNEAYNNGNCFGVEEGKIVYRPTSTLSVAFEYRIRYTTDHRIVSRTALAGFDSFNLGTGGNLAFELPNRYEDRRSRIAPNSAYTVVVFEATGSEEFRLLYTLDGVGSSFWTDFTGRAARVTTPAGAQTCADPVLYVRQQQGWSRWSGDWALYDGHIGERGQTTVDCTVRTPAEVVGPQAPKFFNTIFFYGADEGMNFTLHRECSIRPVFSPAPAYGETVATEDICRHDATQAEWIEAVAQMFHLRIFTDERARRVIVEPDTEFWDGEHTAEWSGRTVWDEPVVWEDVAYGSKAERIYGYRSGDGAAARIATDDEEVPYGSWRVGSPVQSCVDGVERRTNPLFAPTVNEAGACADARSALLPLVGDRDDMEQNGVNFTPRIVRWFGMQPLPQGERWSGPAGAMTEYPLAAFHFAGNESCEGDSLCFEDRDGMVGLHRYYDREEALRARRQAVTLTIRIEPHEFEALFTPGVGTPDLRSVFRIDTDRGEVRATLSRIVGYDPQRGYARCRFIPTPDDRI